ncbi:MAG: hypothetical protein HYZ29_34380 [Myxococcales bacterium]|nr:hypothetical protein [Myxococcales bacterium]
MTAQVRPMTGEHRLRIEAAAAAEAAAYERDERNRIRDCSAAQQDRRPRSPRTNPGAFDRGDHVEIAERLIAMLRAETPLVFADGAFYRYEKARGVFVVVPPSRLSQIVQGFAGLGVKTDKKPRPLRLKAHDVQGAIKLAADRVTDDSFFAGARKGVAFEDAFVEVTAKRIVAREHSPDHRARFCYSFSFEREAHPVKLLAFFAEVFRDDVDRIEKVKLLQEYLGVCLLGLATQYQRVIVNVGDGANGKGVLGAVAEGCMPAGSVCSIAPQDVGQEYRRAALAGKLLNIVSELPESDILDSESWKAVVAGDTMTAREIRKAPFTFRPVAGHIYSANRLPGTTDQTHGFWRRLLVVTFNRVFSEAEQKARLAEHILAAERPAIVAWFLAGAQRVIASGGFTLPNSATAAKSRWQALADQVRAFAEECLAPLPLDAPTHDWARAEPLYHAYRGWAVRNGHHPVASNTFAERMRLLQLARKRTNTGAVYPVRLMAGSGHGDE